MKKLTLAIFAILIVTIAAFFLYLSSSKSQREHHIFCETLMPGMSRDDVLISLKSFGDIDNSTAPAFGDGYDEIAIRYTDSQVVGSKTYILSFQDGKYSGASVIPSFWEAEGIGTVNAVCDP